MKLGIDVGGRVIELKLVGVSRPLGKREDKHEPSKFEDVRKLLGLKQHADNYEAAVRHFSPSRDQLQELLSILREELTGVVAEIAEHKPLLVAGPPEWEAEFGVPGAELLAEVSREFEVSSAFFDAPTTTGELAEWIDVGQVNAFRNYYSPWIANFLIVFAARLLFPRSDLVYSAHLNAGFEPFIDPDGSEFRAHMNGRYFEQITWYSLLDFRTHERESQPENQFKRRLRALWPLRKHLSAIDFRLNPMTVQLLEHEGAPQSGAEVLVELADPNLYDTNRTRVDELTGWLVAQWQETPVDSEMHEFMTLAIRNLRDVDRIFTDRQKHWRNTHSNMRSAEEGGAPATFQELQHEAELEFLLALRQADRIKNKFTVYLRKRLEYGPWKRVINPIKNEAKHSIDPVLSAESSDAPAEKDGDDEQVSMTTALEYVQRLDFGAHLTELLECEAQQERFADLERRLRSVTPRQLARVNVYREVLADDSIPQHDKYKEMAKRCGITMATARKSISKFARHVHGDEMSQSTTKKRRQLK